MNGFYAPFYKLKKKYMENLNVTPIKITCSTCKGSKVIAEEPIIDSNSVVDIKLTSACTDCKGEGFYTVKSL